MSLELARKTLRLSALAVLLALIGACSAIDATPPKPTTIALADFPRAYAAAVCEHTMRCGIDFEFASQDACVHAHADGAPFHAPEIAGVQAGTYSYDAKQVAACFAAAAAPCRYGPHGALPSYLAATDPCAAIFAGTKPFGATCLGSDECASGWCGPDGNPFHICPGTCATGPKAGEPCAAQGYCGRDLFCFSGICGVRTPGTKEGDDCYAKTCVDGLFCHSDMEGNNKCAPMVAAGSPCLLGRDVCATGLFCDVSGGDMAAFHEDVNNYMNGGAGVCRKPAGVGAACYTSFGTEALGYTAQHGKGCADGLICANTGSVSAPAFRCLAPAHIGETCSLPAQCPTLEGTCDASHHCVAWPGVGQPCAKQDIPGWKVFTRCAPGLACNPVDSLCVKPLPPGSACVVAGLPCTFGFPCKAGTDGATTCRTGLSELGGGCTYDVMPSGCGKGLSCVQDKCVAPKCPLGS